MLQPKKQKPCQPFLIDEYLKMEKLQSQPHSLNMEQQVLVSIMMNQDCLSDVLSVITKDDFFLPKHRVLFQECVFLAKKGDVADPSLLVEHLVATGKLSQVGGEEYLVDIVNRCPHTAVNTVLYCHRIKHYAVCRQLIKTCNEVMALAYEPKDLKTEDVLDFAESKIMAVQDAITKSRKQEPRLYKDVAKQAIGSIEERYNSGGKITGVSTGFYDLDEMTLGLQKQTLNIVAGRPSMGKTTLAINIAENITLKQVREGDTKTAGLIFSLEMSDESLVEKMLSSIGKIDYQLMRKGNLEESDFNKLTNATAKSMNWPIYIDQTPAITIHDIRTKARRIYKNHGALAYIVVDYLQLIAPTQKGFSRESEIAEISRALKALAKELNCPVVALSQLSRDVEKRTNKRPVLSDLRESGQIEQDADLIIFVYRDEYYNLESKDKGIAELIVAKQRQGQVGVIRVGSELYRSRFVSLIKSYAEA